MLQLLKFFSFSVSLGLSTLVFFTMTFYMLSSPTDSLTQLVRTLLPRASEEILAKLQVAFAAQMFKASECVVCIENEAVMALMPCGHRCACEACAPNLRNCPMCRQPVRESTRIYG